MKIMSKPLHIWSLSILIVVSIMAFPISKELNTIKVTETRTKEVIP